ncbi:MAG: hypothetical protein SynsKO_34280 [Synoicihabitans sp.]
MGIRQIEIQRLHVEVAFGFDRIVAIQAMVVQEPVNRFGDFLRRDFSRAECTDQKQAKEGMEGEGAE